MRLRGLISVVLMYVALSRLAKASFSTVHISSQKELSQEYKTDLTLQLSVTALVYELADRFEVGVTPGDVWVGDSQHAQRRLVELNKGGVVDLSKSKQLQNLNIENQL